MSMTWRWWHHLLALAVCALVMFGAKQFFAWSDSRPGNVEAKSFWLK